LHESVTVTSDRDARWSLSRRELALIFIFWTALASLSALNRVLVPRGGGMHFMSPARPIALAFAESWLWAALTPLIFWISHRYARSAMNVAVRVLMLLAWGALIAFVADWIVEYIRIDVLQVGRRRAARLFAPVSALRLSFISELIIYFAVLAAGFAREYMSRDRVRQQEAERLAVETARLQAQLAQARLEALRMQINPHFLFNTLHAMSALVERDPAGVRRMIARLSELLRYTLETGAEHEVTLRQELEFVRRYLEIMQLRFQGRVEVEVNVDPSLNGAMVPNLILQPLVENAIQHGVSRVRGGGRISLGAERRGEQLVLTIRDNGPGVEGEPESGIGLANTRARLEQMYGDGASVELRPGEEGGTVAEIALPWRVKE
jgi:two-component system, LytTR family, sensor kinase